MEFVIPFLCLAGFLGGFIDSIAGGGGLITLPALVAAGVPPHVALGVNKFQGTFGTSMAVANFARKSKIIWKIAALGIPFALIGAAIGAELILSIPESVVAKVIVALLPPIAAFIFLSKTLKFKRREKASFASLWIATPLVCFFVGMYDGFLGPGTGTFLILALVFFSRLPFINASATAKTFNLASNVGGLVTFIIGGHIFYHLALPMAAGNILGNVIGSHYAIKHGDGFVKKLLLVSISILFVYLIWKYF